ncbi:MAG: hypothetical protein ACHQRM_04990 [Bacteroidia bacterium]
MKHIIPTTACVIFGLACMACLALHPAFRLVQATSQTWIAGIPGGGSGTEYSFKVVIHTKETIRFDSAWMNGKGFTIQAVKGKQYDPKSMLMKNDTVDLRVSDNIAGHMPGEEQKVVSSPKINPPVALKGAALIRYYLNNKLHYFHVQSIQKLTALNRP